MEEKTFIEANETRELVDTDHKDQLIVEQSEFKDVMRMDIRYWYAKGPNTYARGNKGINIPFIDVPALLGAMVKVYNLGVPDDLQLRIEVGNG